MKPEMNLADLIAKQAIGEVLVRYARAIDRRDAALLRSVYWPDATDNHGIYNGPVEGFVEMILPYLAPQRTQHVISNVLIDLQGDQARVESYVTAMHIRPGPDAGEEDYVVGGRYIDLMERRDGEWRILHRLFMEDWHSARPAARRREGPNSFPRTYGVHGPEDLSYAASPWS